MNTLAARDSSPRSSVCVTDPHCCLEAAVLEVGTFHTALDTTRLQLAGLRAKTALCECVQLAPWPRAQWGCGTVFQKLVLASGKSCALLSFVSEQTATAALHRAVSSQEAKLLKEAQDKGFAFFVFLPKM